MHCTGTGSGIMAPGRGTFSMSDCAKYPGPPSPGPPPSPSRPGSPSHGPARARGQPEAAGIGTGNLKDSDSDSESASEVPLAVPPACQSRTQAGTGSDSEADWFMTLPGVQVHNNRPGGSESPRADSQAESCTYTSNAWCRWIHSILRSVCHITALLSASETVLMGGR